MKDTKNYILETSFRLFLQKSFKEVTMSEIVKTTGLSKGAFYHYFNSKEQLFNEIIDNYYMSFFRIDYTQFNQESLYDFYHDYFNYIERGLAWMAAEFGTDQEMNAINYYLLVFDAIRLYPGFREKTIQMTEHELRSWMAIVKTARENGEVRSPMTDEQIAKVFTSTNDGIGLHAIMLGRFDKMIQEILDVFDGFYTELKA